MTDPAAPSPPSGRPRPKPSRRRRTILRSLAAAALLAVGAVAGAGAMRLAHEDRAAFDAALPTTPIAQLADADRVEVAGRVVEIFGNKFVVEDGGGRALVETGRAGEGAALVGRNDAVTVQGRFDGGFLHAAALQYADGRVEELRPPPPRHRGPGGRDVLARLFERSGL